MNVFFSVCYGSREASCIKHAAQAWRPKFDSLGY